LWLFRARGVAVQVLEVGLGGRLDAVNLVDADAAIVTSIGLDHTDWLGPDRESIALEKAHVFRPGRLAVCAEPDPPRAIAAHAEAIGARLQRAGRDFVFSTHDGAWNWFGNGRALTGLPMPGLAGDEQLRNASGVIAALEGLRERLPIPDDAVRRALPRLALRGRFERVGDTIFDVAHNAEAATALAAKLARVADGHRVPVVLGMLSVKPVEAVCRALAPVASGVHAITLPPPRGLAAAELLAKASAAGLSGVAHEGIGAALAAARAQAGPGRPVLVTGSFLTVAAGLAHE
jgi:dihydrofolate synthase/folylpolyglutamate synthase